MANISFSQKFLPKKFPINTEMVCVQKRKYNEVLICFKLGPMNYAFADIRLHSGVQEEAKRAFEGACLVGNTMTDAWNFYWKHKTTSTNDPKVAPKSDDYRNGLFMAALTFAEQQDGCFDTAAGIIFQCGFADDFIAGLGIPEDVDIDPFFIKAVKSSLELMKYQAERDERDFNSRRQQ